MTKLSFKERFERLGLVRGINPVSSGSPATLSLRMSRSLAETLTIEAMIALRRRGVPVLKAKRAVEAAVEGRPNVVEAPMVEDLKALGRDLDEAGFALSTIGPRQIDVKSLREALDLTQEQFALSFGLELDAVRNWEYGRREPDSAARSYLQVIERAPELVKEALAVEV